MEKNLTGLFKTKAKCILNGNIRENSASCNFQNSTGGMRILKTKKMPCCHFQGLHPLRQSILDRGHLTDD